MCKKSKTMSDSIANFVFFTNAQFIVLLTVESISCALSIWGSITIMYLVCNRKNIWRDKEQLYHRIVLGLSIMDIISTSAMFISPYLNRKDTNIFYAQGNAASCEWGTFFFIFHTGSVAYNCALSFYFVRTIRYGKNPGAVFTREYLMHAAAICVPLSIGITGIVLKMFNPLPYLGFCGIAPYPWTCFIEGGVECERGSSKSLLPYVYLGLYFLQSSIGIVCTWLVYWTIRAQAKKSSRWTRAGGLEEMQRKRTRSVGIQAIWYTAAFFIGFLSNIFLAVLNAIFFNKGGLEATSVVYGGTLFMFFVFPLQGFFNGLIYIRPKVVRSKNANPDKSWFWAYRQVLTGNNVPSSSGVYQSSSRAVTTTAAGNVRSVVSARNVLNATRHLDVDTAEGKIEEKTES